MKLEVFSLTLSHDDPEYTQNPNSSSLIAKYLNALFSRMGLSSSDFGNLHGISAVADGSSLKLSIASRKSNSTTFILSATSNNLDSVMSKNLYSYDVTRNETITIDGTTKQIYEIEYKSCYIKTDNFFLICPTANTANNQGRLCGFIFNNSEHTTVLSIRDYNQSISVGRPNYYTAFKIDGNGTISKKYNNDNNTADQVLYNPILYKAHINEDDNTYSSGVGSRLWMNEFDRIFTNQSDSIVMYPCHVAGFVSDSISELCTGLYVIAIGRDTIASRKTNTVLKVNGKRCIAIAGLGGDDHQEYYESTGVKCLLVYMYE